MLHDYYEIWWIDAFWREEKCKFQCEELILRNEPYNSMFREYKIDFGSSYIHFLTQGVSTSTNELACKPKHASNEFHRYWKLWNSYNGILFDCDLAVWPAYDLNGPTFFGAFGACVRFEGGRDIANIVTDLNYLFQQQCINVANLFTVQSEFC